MELLQGFFSSISIHDYTHINDVFKYKHFVFYFAIRKWSKDLKHLIPRTGAPGKQG